MNPRWQKSMKDMIEALVFALILAFFIKSFFIQAFKIPSGSMLQTLQIGDHLLVNKIMYGIRIPIMDKLVVNFSDPEHGDIVVFRYPIDTSTDFIKRVIGVPGDRISLEGKVVYRNGEALEEAYVQHIDPNIFPTVCERLPDQEGWQCPCRDNIKDFVVPEDKYFVMGDNRDGSKDSRCWGYVDRELIIGKAWVIYWSWDKRGITKLPEEIRWDRVGTIVK